MIDFLRCVALGLAMSLAACGGGGGETSAPVSNPSAPTPSAPTPSDLQLHLAACPTTFTANEAMPCMVGQYQGKTTTAAVCSFVYDSNGIATYTTGGHTVRAILSSTTSTAVFEKKAAANSAGFSIEWFIGIASGNDMDLYYQSAREPTSANGLFIKPEDPNVPTCLVESGPAAPSTGSGATENLLGRTWQAPQMLNGNNGAVGLFSDQPAFDAGMADDGRAFITFRQPDANGRMAVYVVEGRPGASGQSPAWTAPQVLDADAPLAGPFRPRIAVSANGHAVAMWAHERACEADGYYGVNAGKTCRYVYASRRLASDAAWEPALRVAAAPLAATDYYARINSRGDSVLVFNGAVQPVPGSVFSTDNCVAIARRQVDEVAYRVDRSAWIRRTSTLRRLAEWVHVELDEASNIVIAAETNSTFGAVLRTRLNMVQPITENETLTHADYGVYQATVGGGGFAAYTVKSETGPYNAARPGEVAIYSPVDQQWLNVDITPYVLWGDTTLVGTDSAQGEFILYAGCKLTTWRAGTWSATRDLPAYCGRDQSGGVYAFNRKGDYLGINWAGKPGQWGYFSYTQDKMLKGAPGDGAAIAADYVLGTPTPLFGAQPTQLLLAANGLALAVTTNTYTSLPSAADAAGVSTGSAAKLWAVYLK